MLKTMDASRDIHRYHDALLPSVPTRDDQRSLVVFRLSFISCLFDDVSIALESRLTSEPSERSKEY